MNAKRIISLMLAVGMLVSAMSFTGCDILNELLAGQTSGGASTKTLVMEAEHIDIENVAGAGISNNNSGFSMIYGDGTDEQKEMWSGGYYVGYTHNDQTVLTFKFNASKDTTATVTFALGCELADMVLNEENLAIVINGEEQYGYNWQVKCSEMDEAKFYNYSLNNIELKEGENTIEIKVLPQSPKTYGPLVDFVKVVAADADLSWEAHEDNAERRDNEV